MPQCSKPKQQKENTKTAKEGYRWRGTHKALWGGQMNSGEDYQLLRLLWQ